MEFVNKSKSELRLEEMKSEVMGLVDNMKKIMENGYFDGCESSISAELRIMSECLDDMANLDGINGKWIADNQKKIEGFKKFYVYPLGLSVDTFDNSFLKGTMKSFGLDYSKVANRVQDVKSSIAKIDETLDKKIVKTEQPER